MHYNVEGRQPFGVRWQPARPKPGEGGSAAATPLWAERSDGAFSNGRSLSSGFLCRAQRRHQLVLPLPPLPGGVCVVR